MKKKLLRSKTNRVIFGVCGGISEYFDLNDATIVRLLTAIGSVFIPVGILCYLIAAIIIPQE